MKQYIISLATSQEYKIGMIKLFRLIYPSLGLREAKDLMDPIAPRHDYDDFGDYNKFKVNEKQFALLAENLLSCTRQPFKLRIERVIYDNDDVKFDFTQ